MLRTCEALPRLETLRRLAALGLAVSPLVAIGCGDQTGVVGVEPTSSAGAPSVGPTFSAHFTANEGAAWVTQTPISGATVSFGVEHPSAEDGALAELRFPGHAEFTAADHVGAAFATQIATADRFHFGTYRSRVQFGSCGPHEETIGSMFGYFSDGSDGNGNSLTDDFEINFQVTCGAPSYAYVTVFTDYEPATGEFRKWSHIVDFSTGNHYDTPRNDEADFVLTRSDPSWVLPGFIAADQFYELGFEWHSESIRFFLVVDGAERTLWELTGAANIPQEPVQLMFNMWHPETHWYPADDSAFADYPAEDVVMRVDWVEYWAEGTSP